MEVVPSSSSSPFGRVLKDHNLRERRPSTTAPPASKSQTNLQKTLQELVREHLLSSISACNENSNSNQTTNPRSSNGSNSKSFSVSCLVQKWRGFENPPTPDDQIQNQEPVRMNSMESDNDESVNSDWESDQAPVIEGDEMKKKMIRVVDIMKKLPLKVPHGRLESGLRSPPRIRGRQAITDLLARLARDRYDEVDALAQLHVVSKFPKRGHIQSLLKFRLLRGEPSPNTHRHHQLSRAQEFSKAIQQRLSSVNSLRRRFSKGQVELNDLASALNQTLIAAEANKENNTQEEINLCQINDETPESFVQEQEEVEIINGVVEPESKNEQRNEEEEEEDEEDYDTPRSNASTEAVLQEDATTPLLQVVEAEDPPQEIDEEEGAEFHYGAPEKTANSSRGVWDEEDYGDEIVENEEYYDDNDYFESSLDWIHDISRPHSYWESRRQAWYQEIFESSTNNDIRRLIERGSVSAVLASDFRDRMDQLMTSNVQLQMHSIDSGENEGPSRVVSFQTQMSDLVEEDEEHNQETEQHQEQDEETFSEKHVDVNREMEKKDEEFNNREQTPLTEEEEEEEEEYSREQTPLLEEEEDAPLMELPWSSYQNEEEEKGAADPEQIRREESFVTNSYYDHGSQVGSSSKNTIEMELISDIRAHMQQMYNEMSELRKAVNGCTDMQSKLQSSIREEVSAAIININGKESKRKAAKKGLCRICNKKKADSLFYRCGHMCTCFECAHELQWSSGKCPVCWAEIVDVVRVCTDYY